MAVWLTRHQYARQPQKRMASGTGAHGGRSGGIRRGILGGLLRPAVAGCVLATKP